MARPLTYPTGARPLLIDEAARRKAVEARFVSTLESAGFAEIILPIIDYTEPYAALLDAAVAKQAYRFVDRDGELVSVRSDFTPMIARALSPSLEEQQLPLRIFYRGDVIRCDASRLGTNREMFQIGAEIVGDASAAADAEVLLVAADLVRRAGAEPLVIWTDLSILQHFDETSRAALTARRITPAIPRLVQRLIEGNATADDLRAFSPEAAERVDALTSALGGDPAFVLHLDDFDTGAGYYTGIRFRVFGSDRRRPLAEGGRYDGLYGRFGTAAPAVGFTFTVGDANRDS